MDAWIELARGPLFRLALTICVLFLALRLANAVYLLAAAWWRAGDRDLPWKSVAQATARWLFPYHLLTVRPLYSAASFLFHVGILLLPFFLAGHVALLKGILPTWWPTLAPILADTFTLLSAAAVMAVLLARATTASAQALSTVQDVAVLLLLLLVLGAGFFASHPATSPFDARAMLLVHILSGNLALLLTPFTKLVHCILVPLTQLASEVGWHFPAESGRHVAVVLNKENEPV